QAHPSRPRGRSLAARPRLPREPPPGTLMARPASRRRRRPQADVTAGAARLSKGAHASNYLGDIMTAETARSGHSSATALRSSGWRRELSFAGVVVIVATLVNLGLYLTGRVAGATLRLDPAVGPANHQITAPDVAWKTAVPLAAGVLV